jgi:hypothetical protein
MSVKVAPLVPEFTSALGELAVIVSTVLESAGTAPPSVATERPDESPTQQP